MLAHVRRDAGGGALAVGAGRRNARAVQQPTPVGVAGRSSGVRHEVGAHSRRPALNPLMPASSSLGCSEAHGTFLSFKQSGDVELCFSQPLTLAEDQFYVPVD
eukprot:5954452-Pyramimonas_sp.AAC.1